MKEQDPLVSVIVITYNSSQYVLETLESIKAQSYQNIELIISDDCSKDNTVDICRQWLEDNSDSFVKTELITVENNTGIPGNCNRGVHAANGEWIKIIAGDDILDNECIAIFIEYFQENKAAEIIVGKIKQFSTVRFLDQITPYPRNLRFFRLNSEKQYRWFLTRSFNIAPAAFIKKSLLEKAGFFDERYKYFEDLPFWLKVLKRGIKIHFVDKVVVNYRIGESMVNSSVSVYNVAFMRSVYQFRREFIYKNVPIYNFVFFQSELVEWINYKIALLIFKNKRNKASLNVNKLISFFIIKKYWYYFSDIFNFRRN